LPFADSFLDDLNQGYLRLIVQRVSYRKYKAAKIIAVALAGGFSLVLAVLLIFLAGLVGATDWNATLFYSNYIDQLSFPRGPLGALYTASPFFYLLYLLASAFGFGAVFAALGLAISPLIHNRYIVLGGPLVLVQVLDFLETRSLHVTNAFNLLNGLLPYEALSFLSPDYTVRVQLTQLGVVLAVSVAAFLVLARKQRLVL
jgi:hypothetical protein